MLIRSTILVSLAFAAGSGSARARQEEPKAPAPTEAHTPQTTPHAADLAARGYVSRCTGCHTIGRGVLTGPDLAKAITWQGADLRIAILRMQEKTGPIAPDEVDTLITFLKDENRDVRIAAEVERLAAQFAVELDPPSAATGRTLFLGRSGFQNGGTACVACHPFSETDGGNLGPDLTGIVARLGRQGLLSATEKPAFKVMAPLYREHPLTRQEVVHLTRFFEEMDRGVVQRAGVPWLPSLLLVVLGLGCVVWYSRRHAPRASHSNGRGRS